MADLRAGMEEIILRLRQMGEAGTADYSVAGKTYWQGADLQALADRHRQFFHAVSLVAEPQQVSSTTYYYRYRLPNGLRPDGHALEGTAGGTAAFRVDDSTGALIAGTLYTFNGDALDLVFSADQAGSARYWTGFAYDLNAIAYELWIRKASHSFSAINFTADGHRFERGAVQANCLAMAELFNRAKGVQTTRLVRSDVV